jgi:hypothetical protein
VQPRKKGSIVNVNIQSSGDKAAHISENKGWSAFRNGRHGVAMLICHKYDRRDAISQRGRRRSWLFSGNNEAEARFGLWARSGANEAANVKGTSAEQPA